jgi:nitrate/nitrite transport system substrate-binding protein
VAVPADVMRSSRLMDSTVWDGKDAKGYATGFEVHYSLA